MKHFSTRIIVLALFVAILSTLFIGCGSDEAPHTCQFKNGECKCGKIDETYYSEGMEFLLDEEKQEYTVIGYEGEDVKLMIPATYMGLPVTKIADSAFSYDMSYGMVHIGKNVHTIGEKAFYGAQRLVKITIPEQIKNIGLEAFGGCVKVREIHFNAINCNSPYPDKNFATRMEGIWTHVGKDSLTKECVLYIGNKVKAIPDGMFHLPSDAQKAYITSVIFEDNSQCQSIGNCSFYNLRKLATMEFGENSSLKRIGQTAFGNSFLVEEYVIPDTIEVIEKHAFGGNTKLTRIVLPQSNWLAIRYSQGVEIDRLTFSTSTPEENRKIISDYGYYNLTRQVG